MDMIADTKVDADMQAGRQGRKRGNETSHNGMLSLPLCLAHLLLRR